MRPGVWQVAKWLALAEGNRISGSSAAKPWRRAAKRIY